MGVYLEFGTGCSVEENSLMAGRSAAETACKCLKKYEPALVMVYSSVKYNLEQVLKGVREITGNTPLVGGTTAGEYCHDFRRGSVMVSVIASRYLSVRTGVGQNVSSDYRQAVQDAIDTSGAQEYFDEFRFNIGDLKPDLDYTKKIFALVFLPGVTGGHRAPNYDVIEIIRKRSLNDFPLVGACTGDSLDRQKSFQFHDEKVLTDSLVMVVFESHLKFGVAAAFNHVPSGLPALITRVDGYEIKEFYHQPAAEFYAKLLDVDMEELKRDPRRYFVQNPMGICDDLGNYSVIMASDITPDNGIMCLRRPYTNATITLMNLDPDKLAGASEEAVSKAIHRGRITKPGAVMLFSSVYRTEYFGDRYKAMVRDALASFHKKYPSTDYSGFISYGEVGTNDEGISTYMDYAITSLIIADEMNSASMVVFNNKLLYEELSATAIRNQVLYEELSTVHQLGNLLNSSLDLKFVMNKTVEMVGQIYQADGCALFIYDARDDSFQLSGLYDENIPPKDIDWKETLPYVALREEKPLIVNNVKGNPAVSENVNRITGARSIIAAPIIVRGEKVGAISAYSRENDFFNSNDLEFLQTLANQVGTAIANARLFQQTQMLACTDGLTGLYDHNYFLKSLSRMIDAASKKKQNLSLIMVDLDDFKYCNDRYGHTVGDAILRETAEIMKKSVRNDDVIARYGGDEFAVILNNAPKERAYKIAERIRKGICMASFEDPESEATFGITASIGIATFPEDASTAKHLINRADKAMYRIKRHVKNKTQTYLSDFTELEKEFTASEKAFFDTLKILVQILDSKDRYTWEHSRQVAWYSVRLAEEMGLSEQEKYLLRLTGYLHDIGKIHVSSEILNKKGILSTAEFAAIKLHPVVGANLLAPIKGFKKILPIVYHHHEWFNGSGYPDGLKGHNIPKGARILTVADGFDAMTSNRPYRKAKTAEWAVEELISRKGIQYDPEIVDIFTAMILRDLEETAKKDRRASDRGR
ncbi:MAG: hypothetical protein CVU89_14460 [Firmicutes bacterium HGW-Firmicutes-14]|nr:MAG: hypothetical protein CVU89_14460 [Firmicutes bacterium HGW-Firmicutes-14]